MTSSNKKPLSSSGQTAIELAIFGAILLFVLGLIVKTNLGYGLNQNNSLRATRMALTASYLSSSVSDCNAAGGNAAGNGTAGKYDVPCIVNGGRSSASVLFIEDRIMPDMSHKYGGFDRTPLISMGSGTFTPNLYMPPVDDHGNPTVPCQWTASANCPPLFGAPNPTPNNVNPDAYYSGINIPRMDFFINGQHFPFTVAAHGSKTVASWAISRCERQILWEDKCVARSGKKTTTETLLGALVFLPILFMDFEGDDMRGCLKLVKKTNNHRANGRWCDHDDYVDGVGDADPIRNCNLTSGELNGEEVSHINHMKLDYRFDLDQSWWNVSNSLVSDTCCPVNSSQSSCTCSCPAVPDVSNVGNSDDPVNYRNFGWQWTDVLAVNIDAKHYKDGKYVMKPGQQGISVDTGVNTNIDVDLDGQEERIVWVTSSKAGDIDHIWYMDFQNGDMDMTYDTLDYQQGKPTPGLGREMKLISRARDGTYLQIEEGKLFTWDSAQQYVRETQKKDKVDVIEREIQLSNNTGRFCGTTIDSDPTGGYDAPVRPNYVDGGKNPVEVCCSGYNCSNGASTCMATQGQTNVKTCMDMEKLVIYVRTNVADLGGRKWITKVPNDQ